MLVKLISYLFRDMSPRRFRWLINLYPPYFFTRTKLVSVAPDWRELTVVLKFGFLTRNYVGTTFGGSMYAACDPFLMFMLIKIFGMKEHIIWDKGARIDFKKPARSKLTYHFVITEAEVNAIQQGLKENGKVLPEFRVQGVDQEGEVCIDVQKTLYIRKKN